MDIKIQTDFSEVYKWIGQTAVDLKMVDCIEITDEVKEELKKRRQNSLSRSN